MSHFNQLLDAPAQSLHVINFTLPELWQHTLELFFIRIESAFYSANVIKELAKCHKLVEVLPASVISQVQSLLSNPPANVPYSTLKAQILRLTSLSDQQRYHQLIKEESLGDRKPSGLLRRMRSLLGDMQVDDKLVKMFLERLPADVQTILASGSQDLTVSQLAEMVDRMTEVQRFQSPSVAQISTSSSTVNEQLMKEVSAMAVPPVFARLRRLASKSFQAAKAEFEHMLQLGIIRSSESPWASSLHMVPKATSGDWRHCSDYRALNSATIPDRYPVSHLQDFAKALFSEAVFSKIDLVDSEGLRPLPSKVEAVRNFPPPTSKRQLQRFLGMVSFYRRFLPNCADLMLPLTNMLSGPKGLLELTVEALTAFEKIKNSLADATLLTHPAPEAQLSLMMHKDGAPLRPIVPLKGTPTYGLAKWLFRRLKLLTAESDTTVSSSAQYLEKLKGDLAIETIELLLQSKYYETENRLGHALIFQLLKLCLRTYFTFDRTIYKQVKGTPMGSPISGFIAEAVLQRLESLVSQNHRPKFWVRYVDDTFVVIERDQMLTFHEHLNAVFPDIQITMEEEENNQLAFLDVLVCRKDCGGLKTKVFRKATNTMQVLNFNSNHPISHKRSCVRTLYRRVETHCSESEDKIAEL
ncbi:hypothetical protein SprV_0602133100 [Sparganum proliferum]